MNWSERTDGAPFHKIGRIGKLDFSRKANAVRRELNWLTHRMANMARDHTMENFKVEGFIDQGTQRWPKRKRGSKSRPLLVKTGKLKSSIRVVKRTRNSVSLSSPVSYAGIHNRPVGQMKRYGQYTYPGRKFMGHSATLAKATRQMIVTRLNMALQA